MYKFFYKLNLLFKRIVGYEKPLRVALLGYLSLNGLLKSVTGRSESFCSACFTGKYPIPVQLEMDKMAMERP